MMRLFGRLLLALALITAASLPAFAADPPLIMQSGKIKQLPSGTTLQLRAPATGSATINLPHGTAPTSPNNGDCWTTTVGLYCRINGSTVGPYGTGSGGGGTSTAWTLVATATITTPVANVDITGLSGNEYLVLTRGITKSVSGVTTCQLSVNNGVSFYSTSGDYISILASGVESNSNTSSSFHAGNRTAASGGFIQIMAAPGSNRFAWNPNRNDELRVFTASSAQVDAIRILGHLGGNLTAGTIYVFAR